MAAEDRCGLLGSTHALCILQLSLLLLCAWTSNFKGNVASLTSCEQTMLHMFGHGHCTLYFIWTSRGLSDRNNTSRLTSRQRRFYAFKVILVLILLSGDIHLNPGPTTFEQMASTELEVGLSTGVTSPTPESHGAELRELLAQSQEPLDQRQAEKRSSPSLSCLCTTDRNKSGESPRLMDPYSGIEPGMHLNGSGCSAVQKQKQYLFFQTVNHARVLWDVKCKPKGILGGHLNIRSLISKRDQISVLLLDSNLDYLCLTESWLHSNVPNNMIDIAGYQCFRTDRNTGKGGGVLIYIKDQFKCHIVELKTTLECLALNVILSPTMNFNIVVIYN